MNENQSKQSPELPGEIFKQWCDENGVSLDSLRGKLNGIDAGELIEGQVTLDAPICFALEQLTQIGQSVWARAGKAQQAREAAQTARKIRDLMAKHNVTPAEMEHRLKWAKGSFDKRLDRGDDFDGPNLERIEKADGLNKARA